MNELIETTNPIIRQLKNYQNNFTDWAVILDFTISKKEP